jgi:hypothetical protein
MKFSKKHLISISSLFVIIIAILILSDTMGSEKGSFTIIDPMTNRPHIYTYKNISAEFYHTGRYLFFRAATDTDTKTVASKALQYTGYYKSARLEKALIEFNGLKKGIIPAGSTLLIPHSAPAVIPDVKNRSKSPLIFTRGLYYTGTNAGSERLLSSLDSLIDAGINTVVFDAKDITGIVNYNSRVPEVNDLGMNAKRSIDDIDKLIRAFKSRGIYVIARIAVFRDQMLAKRAPDLAIKSKKTGKLWNEGTAEIWCDPTNRDTQDYNLSIAVELAEKGVDEIQFDYIRFPTGGTLDDARFEWSYGVMPKDKSIEHFLARAYKEISQRNVNLSIDVFGVIAWGHDPDIMKTGQRIELLSRYCDVLSPMLYPSHFNDNFDGYSKPGDAPYYFINEGCNRFKQRSSKALIRPWLQAFGWKVSNYNERYIIEQISASNNAKAQGYLFWNAANNYDTVIRALKTMKGTNGKSVTHSGKVIAGENL